MESDNLNQLLVENGANEKSNQINNLETEKLDQLKQTFPKFDEFCGQLKYEYYRQMNFLSFPIDEHNYHKPVDLNSLKPRKLGNDREIGLSTIRKFGLPIFIIISFLLMFSGIPSGVSFIIILIVYLLL